MRLRHSCQRDHRREQRSSQLCRHWQSSSNAGRLAECRPLANGAMFHQLAVGHSHDTINVAGTLSVMGDK